VLHAIVANRLNLLVGLVPVCWALTALAPGSAWIFATAALSLVPLAGLIGLGTEQLAERAGPAWGGFLNATFGNAAELIIGIVALNDRRVALVKASITGSIVGNLLLVLGLSFFVGGLGRRSQKFHRTAATNAASMLFLAVVALVMPAVVDLALYGNLKPRPGVLDRLSFWSALVLIAAYVGSLIYAFTARRDLFRPTRPTWRIDCSMGVAIAVLAGATVLTTIQAEILVGAIGPALARFGFTELFAGVIVVALIGNAAEHFTAVAAARRDEMSLTVEIAIGSSAQIALLVGPALVLYSWAIGRPMSLILTPLEITGIIVSVLATSMVVVDGESNWVEGLQLLSVYLILAIAFYLMP
jgi:Ca2+:H+ antiporter